MSNRKYELCNDMLEELVVHPNVQVAVQSRKLDVLALYGVPDLLNQVTRKEKANLLKGLEIGAVLVDSINQASNANRFYIDIPAGMQQLLTTGKAVFDSSNKVKGNFTPNIRINGKAGIQAQVTIAKKTDPIALSNAVSNLAMMGMVQAILEKLDVLEGKVDKIINGQHNDRVGQIIGSFKSFMDLYPTFKTTEEMHKSCNDHYREMEQGLAKLHLEMDEKRQRLIESPSNHWEQIKWMWKTKNLISFYQTKSLHEEYNQFVYDWQLYNRLMILAEVLYHLKNNSSTFGTKHKVIQKYADDVFTPKFRKQMLFLTNGHTPEIDAITTFVKNCNCILGGEAGVPIAIELSHKEINDIKIRQL